MNRIGALPKDIKRKNDTEILRSLADQQVFTVQDIADKTRISRLTVTRALERFMEKGIVVQSGKGNSTSLGGKKPQEYVLNPNCYAISIAPSGGKTLCTLMSFDGNEIASADFDFPSDQTYSEFIDNCISCIKRLVKENDISQQDLYGVVLCSGGIIDPKEGVFRVSSISRWGSELRAAEDIASKLPFKTHIEVENVSKVCSSMLRFNDEVRNKRAAVMYSDYGTSITLLDDGMVPDTTNNINGELGHMCLAPDDEEVCVCGARGCFEVLISQKRIMKLIGQLNEEERRVLLEGYDGKEDIRIHLLRKEGSGNENIDELCSYLAKYVGLAFRNVCLAYDPDLFVVQGIFSHASDRFFEKVKDVIRENKYLENIVIDIRKENRELSEMLKKGGMNIILSSILEE